MFSILRSERGEGGLKAIIILLLIVVGAYVVFQYAQTKVKVASMESVIKEEATGAKIRQSWDEIIIENILREATDNGILEPGDIESGAWEDKLVIDIYRPTRDFIEITIKFDVETNYLVTTKKETITLTEKAKIYDM